MSPASTLRLAHALPLAFGLAFLWPEAADAGLYVPHPVPGAPTETSAAAPRRSVDAAAPMQAIDGEGRSLSMSVPSRVRLYGLARAEEIAARTVLEPTGAGTARLSLSLDGDVVAAGAYVGVVEMSLDYN